MLCLNSLKEQTMSPKEIILVLDPNPSLILFYEKRMPSQVKIVISEGKGLSSARNTGVKNAKGDFIAFIDDDACAEKNWLEELSANYDDPQVIGVGGFVQPSWETERPLWLPNEIDWVVGCSHKWLSSCKKTVRNPIGCNMSFRRNIFETVGGFDSNFGRFGKRLLSGEEAAFSFTALRRIPGSKIMYEPEAVVSHKVSKKRASITYVISRSYYEGYSKGSIARLNLEKEEFLNDEQAYLKSLLTESVPEKLYKFYSPQNLIQLITLSLSTSFVLFGFLLGRFSKHKD